MYIPFNKVMSNTCVFFFFAGDSITTADEMPSLNTSTFAELVTNTVSIKLNEFYQTLFNVHENKL